MKIYNRGTAQQFENWHSPIAIEKGYAVTGRNAKTKNLAPTKCKTTAYSAKIFHPTNNDDYIWLFGEYQDEGLLALTMQEAIDARFIQEQE